MHLQTKQTQKKRRYGAIQLSCSSAKEVEGDGSVVVAFFAKEEEGEEEEEEEGEVAAQRCFFRQNKHKKK